MADTLGGLYEPVSLSSAFQGAELVLGELRSRLPGWIEGAARIDPHGKTYVSRWRHRAKEFYSLRGIKANRLREVDNAIRTLEESTLGIRSQVNGLSGRLDFAEQELEFQKVAAKPANEAAKAARREAVTPLMKRMRPLLDRRAILDCHSDEFKQVSHQIDQLRVEIHEAQRASSNPRNPAVQTLVVEIGNLRAQLRPLREQLNRLEGEIGRLSRARESLRQWLGRPWGETDNNLGDQGFRSRDLWGLPPELDTIALGKVYGRVFEFLAGEGRLWVATRPDRPYAGTLVGPRFVIEDVMMILARHVSEQRDNCVLMTGGDRAEAFRRSMGQTGGVATVSWLLPSPRTTNLAAVRRSREGHEAELEVLRTHLRSPIESAQTPRDLRDAVRDIEASCRAASREISRALELDQRVGLRHVKGSAIKEIGSTLRDAATAAALGSLPVVSSVFGSEEAVSGIPSGLVVAGVTLTGMTVLNSYRAHSARKRIAAPFLYSYEAVRVLDA
ncbi:hypothetical protein RhoFasK5_01062|nr:hypothetical protein [Rhodococcus kroppenstedtii]